MKLYLDYPGASVSMSKDQRFIDSLDNLFRNERIEFVFESGTYTGKGSTTTLAEAALKNNAPIQRFITVEVDYKLFKLAKTHLSQYPFITAVWGMTVDENEAKRFIEQDEAINNHQKYPDIFIDDVENPKGFYMNELSGQLSKYHLKQNLLQKIKSLIQPPPKVFESDVFTKYLPEMRDKKPLILLDSAGGVGYLEFNTVLRALEGSPFFLILDDIHHLKHFRSYKQVKNDPSFNIINESFEHGWIIAEKTR